jgi:hypothetical protein
MNLNRQDAKSAKKELIAKGESSSVVYFSFEFLSWRSWRLGGSRKYLEVYQ